MDRVTWDVIVVGAGVVGSATAYQLAKQGFKTLLIEQFSLGHDRGSSFASSRIIRKVYAQDHYAKMMPECLQFWKNLEKEVDTKLFRECGITMVEGGNAARLKKFRGVMERQGAPFQFIESNQQLRSQFPMFNFPSDYKAILDPSGGTLYANKCVKGLQDMSKKYGATILENTRVENIYPKWVTEVTTTNGSFKAKFVVLCPGPWAKTLLQKVGLHIPLKVIPGWQSYWRVKSPGTFSPDKTPTMVHEQPVSEGYLFRYSFPEDEFPGLVKLATRGEPLLEPVDVDARSKNTENERRVMDGLRQYVWETYPDLEDKPALIEPCLYTVCPDHKYILDRHPKYKNVLVAAGMSGHGFKAAPIVGKMITELIENKPTSYDISHYSLKRFKHTDSGSSKL